MDRLLLIFCRRPWLTLLALGLLSFVAAQQLSSLRVHIGADELTVRGDPDRIYYQEIQRRFGDSQVALLYLQDDQPLHPDKLTQLKPIVDGIAALPYVDRVDSLFSVPRVQTIDGFLNKDPYLATLPVSQEQANSVHLAALDNPFLKSVLLSPDQRVFALAIVLKDDVSVEDTHLSAELNRRITPLPLLYERAFVIGYAQVRVEIGERIKAEQGKLVPWAMAALLIALFLSLRQFVDVLVPFATAGLSILWVLGLMAASGIPLNIVTSMVPILLIIVGSTEDIHLLTEFRNAQREGLPVEAAIIRMSKRMGGTIALTFLTTFLGFLSVALGGVELLRQFAFVAAIGLLFNFIITISFIPAILRLLGRFHWDGRSPFSTQKDQGPARVYCNWLRDNRITVFIATAAITVVAVFGLTKISINDNPVETLPTHSESRERFELVNEHLAGLESLSIVIESGIYDTFLKTRYIEELSKLQTFIDSTEKAGSTTSFANYLSLLNAAFLEYDEPLLPETDEEVDELMIFLDFKHVQAYVDKDYKSARVLVRHGIAENAELKAFVGQIQNYLDTELDSGLQARITGPSILSITSTKAMLKGQLMSIGLLLVAIILLMSVLFADWRIGVIAALPNLFPVLVLFGVMGFMHIPLNIGTTMAAAIALGIAVNDTLHLMLRYNAKQRIHNNFADAMHAAIQSEALPVMATSAALVAGFLVFTQSEFQPVVQFGVLSAVAIIAALVADFFILPLALSSLRVVTIMDVMSAPAVKEVLQHTQLFKGIRPWRVRRFIAASRVVDLHKGQALFESGDSSDTMYLLISGHLEATVQTVDGEKDIEFFIPGDVVGEVALLASEPRHVRVAASESSRVLEMSRDNIRQGLQRNPFFASRFFFNLSKGVSRRVLRMIDRSVEK